MTSSAQNRNPLGNSLKLSLESLKPIKLPFIYLSFVIMTILHIGFYTWQDISQQNDLKIIEEINFSLLFKNAENSTIIQKLTMLLESYLHGYLIILLADIFVWAFIAHMTFSEKAEWKDSLKYIFTKTPVKLISLLLFIALSASLVFTSLASFSPGLAQMLVFTIVTLTPYYLLTISLPRKKVAKTMSVRFYFNVVTISLFIYLLKSPIDGLLGLLSNLDLSLNLRESVIYNKTIFNAESLCIVLKSALYSFLWISYSVWMATLSKVNLLLSSSNSFE